MSQDRLFGTDGVRGIANETLTTSLGLRLGLAAGHRVRRHATEKRSGVIIGRDTRISGDMLEAAVSAGFASMGVDVTNVGIIPTPGVAQLVLSEKAAAGVVISASHNPFEDNGIKFFGSDGRKLPDSIEDEIAANIPQLDRIPRPTGQDLGRIRYAHNLVQHYADKVKSLFCQESMRPLEGMKLVLDCANGSAYELAPRIFSELGAEVETLYNSPDGCNINVECGSTKPAHLAQRVVETGAHAGLAFDGDADRVMMSDEKGQIVDGDRMMAVIGLDLKESGKLPGDVVIATIMSNIGLEIALRQRGVHLHRTDVGDRYVAAAMDEQHAAIGGEQSGHILLPGLTPTGDGMVTGLEVLRVMRKLSSPLSELAGVVVSYPQLLKNVRVKSRTGWKEDSEIQNAILAGEARLGSSEWLSVRASGTELLIRVMAQGTDRETVESVVHGLCDLIAVRMGGART